MKHMLKCGDHKYAPGGIVCVHLINGTSSEWCPVSDLDEWADRTEIENDWLCPACAAKWWHLQIEDIRCVCIHCIREMREKSSRDDRDRHSAID